MKQTLKILSLLLVLSLVFLPTQNVAARGLDDGPGPVIFGGSYTLKSGDTVDGDVVVFGGVVLIEEGATVNGSVVVFGGTLTINGEVNGDVVLVGGAGALGEESVVDGSLSLVGATLARADGAQVSGEVTYSDHGDMSEERTLPDLPGVPNVPGFEKVSPFNNMNPLWVGLGVFGRALAMALLALLVGLFLEEPTRRVGKSIAAQPVIASGLGFLTIILSPAIFVILAITIILAPVALLAGLVLMVAFLYGWIALGFEVGLRFTKMIHQEWALPLTAAFGTWLLTIISASINLVPCVGWLAPFIIATLALGGVVMSRFGSRIALPVTEMVAPAPVASTGTLDAKFDPEPLPPVDGGEE